VTKEIAVKDLMQMPYKQAWLCQEELFREIVQLKIRNAKRKEIVKTPNYLLYVEHPHVFTLGRRGAVANLLLDEAQLVAEGAEFIKIDRSGDITYHGPGQVVGYPIIDLENFDLGIHQYIWQLEEVIIACLRRYNVESSRLEGASGVWVDAENHQKARKIASIGIRASRHVTMHGWALNVNTDLAYFRKIIPCGMPDKTITSLEKELGYAVDLDDVKLHLSNAFIDVFQCSLVSYKDVALPELL